MNTSVALEEEYSTQIRPLIENISHHSQVNNILVLLIVIIGLLLGLAKFVTSATFLNNAKIYNDLSLTRRINYLNKLYGEEDLFLRLYVKQCQAKYLYCKEGCHLINNFPLAFAYLLKHRMREPTKETTNELMDLKFQLEELPNTIQFSIGYLNIILDYIFGCGNFITATIPMNNRPF
ncbi:hypothetical protein SNEBB_000010 [Seison nebaliae]|nr:hypothetical protein SNEBB_000010 [Seison nebaliae]